MIFKGPPAQMRSKKRAPVPKCLFFIKFIRGGGYKFFCESMVCYEKSEKRRKKRKIVFTLRGLVNGCNLTDVWLECPLSKDGQIQLPENVTTNITNICVYNVSKSL